MCSSFFYVHIKPYSIMSSTSSSEENRSSTHILLEVGTWVSEERGKAFREVAREKKGSGATQRDNGNTPAGSTYKPSPNTTSRKKKDQKPTEAVRPLRYLTSQCEDLHTS